MSEPLAAFLPAQRWFGGKGREIARASLELRLPLPSGRFLLAAARVEYRDGSAERYFLPLDAAAWERGKAVDAVPDADFQREILALLLEEGRLVSGPFEAAARREGRFSGPAGERTAALEPRSAGKEQSNSAVIYGERYFLKLFRRLDAGENPDLEIGRFLTARGFPHAPPIAASLELRSGKEEAMTLGILSALVPARGDGWELALGLAARWLRGEEAAIADAEAAFRLLGQRTAKLHGVLASAPEDPRFSPEPFTAGGARELGDSILALAGRTLRRLRERSGTLPEAERGEAAALLSREGEIEKRIHAFLTPPPAGMRLRCHGDFHLGQALWTGSDWTILDFEGEPARPILERRRKQSPLKDVAGMVRSFHYAASEGARRKSGPAGPDGKVSARASRFQERSSAAYLAGYFEVATAFAFLPAREAERRALLDLHLLEKALYEVAYELDHRPDWAAIPIAGLREILDG